MRYGYIGLGNLGGHLAMSLIREGFEVTVYDKNRALGDRLVAAGATWADSAADVVPLKLLAGLQSLPVLLARCRHPWIMGDLSQYVRSYLQPIVDLGEAASYSPMKPCVGASRRMAPC